MYYEAYDGVTPVTVKPGKGHKALPHDLALFSDFLFSTTAVPKHTNTEKYTCVTK